MSKRRSNKSVKRMVADVYGCNIDYWENRKILHKTKHDDMDEVDHAFNDFHVNLGLVNTISLTASELKGE